MATLATLQQLKGQLDIAMKARAMLKAINDAGGTINLASDNDAAYVAPVDATQMQQIRDVANAAEAQIKTIANQPGF